MTSQFRIEVRRDKLAFYGVSAKYVQDFVETAMNGRVISEVVEGQRRFDLMIRMAEKYRTDVEGLSRMPLELPSGEEVPLSEIATLYESGGPSVVKREKASRRIVVRVNTKADGDLSTAVDQIKDAVDTRVTLPEGYYIIYGGQFEEQRAAVQRIMILSLVALAVIFIVLYSTYPSTSIVLQLLFALPVAFVGGVIALVLTKQSLNVATVVGFISLGGIAARNGLLLVSTYLDRLPEEGFTPEMILNGSLERLSPVLMTALTTGVGLVPLVIGGQLPGKEILFPVATVILGGLVTSTFCEFLIRPGLFMAFSEHAAPRIANRRVENSASLTVENELATAANQ